MNSLFDWFKRWGKKGQTNSLLDQGSQIQQALLEAILGAQASIRVAVAWFTDQKLLDALIVASKKGVRVQLVIGEDEKNNLPYLDLSSHGANVWRLGSEGYGMMHNKYAIFDDEIVFHGSYNWTKNAATNNSESVVKSHDRKLVESFVESFEKLVSSDHSQSVSGKQIPQSGTIQTVGGVFRVSDREDVDFLQTLDDITKGWISEFDEDEIRNRGFDAAESCNGSSNQIPNLLDTVLHEYRVEISNNTSGKSRLLDHLDAVLEHHVDQLHRHGEVQLSSAQREANLELDLIDNKKAGFSAKLGEIKADQLGLRGQLEKLNQRREGVLKEIDEESSSLDVTAVRWYRFAPMLVLVFVSFAYLFTFYSSAVYILLQAKNDALNAINNGIIISVPEVYEPRAWLKARQIGGTLPWFCGIAVVAPVGLALMKLYIKNKVVGEIASWVLAIVAVDFLVAYKITQTIHEVDYLAGNVTTRELVFAEVFRQPDFYLVFILGALPLLLFKYMVENIRGQLSEANSDDQRVRSKGHIRVLRRRLSDVDNELVDVKSKSDQASLSDSEIVSQIEHLENEKIRVNAELEGNQSRLQSAQQRRIVNATRMHTIYKNNVSESHFKVSANMLKGRVAAVMEGWQKFLFGFYSNAKAQDLMGAGNDEKDKWWSQNFESVN